MKLSFLTSTHSSRGLESWSAPSSITQLTPPHARRHTDLSSTSVFKAGQGILTQRNRASNSSDTGTANRGILQKRFRRLVSSRQLAIRPNQRLNGSLQETDKRNPRRRGRYADEFALTGVQSYQYVTVSLNSGSFDAYLEVINTATGRVIAANDDGASNSNSRLSFTTKPGINYRLRATSYGNGETGNYTLTTRTPATILPNDYTADFGYGLIDAAAAIARTGIQGIPTEVPSLNADGWGLNLVNAPGAWAQGFTGQGITVAVLDAGVDYNHSDLKDNIWSNPGEIAGNGIDDDNNGFIDDIHGWNFLDNNNNLNDSDGHGTHVSGTIAAGNNGFGVTGVAFNATIMPIKTIPGPLDGRFLRQEEDDANLANSIRYAVRYGARVINMSLGNNPGDPPLPLTRSALSEARQAGVVTVMASGNEKLEGAIQPIYPALYAAHNLGIAVGAVNERRQVADFSNPAGNRPLDFVVAPGVTVYSTDLGNQYSYKDGTSMAAPHVAGVVALLLSANPALTPDQVEALILETASSRGITVL